MTPAEHYLEAERLLAKREAEIRKAVRELGTGAQLVRGVAEASRQYLAEAQVHATLAIWSGGATDDG